MASNFVYCIFCETSLEKNVETFLKGLGYNVISALVERNIVKNGKQIKELRSIIPGYVFFECDFELDWSSWKEINNFNSIYYPLHYSNREKILKDNDLLFVKWLKRNNGIIKVSKA
ncbi:MAG: transcription termination/antitermination NusG family protein, partial [Azoarcus sp.]|nr:transcription termination/antitermination NusG family protein [Azoarcus sp.]